MSKIRPIEGATQREAAVPPAPRAQATATRADGIDASPTRAYAGQRLADPAPPFAVSSTFEEADEQRLIASGPALVAYGSYDASRDPVVLVHGIDGAPRDMLAIADRLRASGRQVFLFCYDDMRTPPARSGEAFARALEALRQAYPHTQRLDIVAHSCGGIVTRAALSSLANPSWLTQSTEAANPRAGFESIRVRTLDTPWQGSSSGPRIPILSQIIEWIVHFFFWLMGRESMWEMRASSDTLTHLHDTALAGVELQNIAAHQASARDGVASLDDFNEQQRLAVVQFIVTGAAPSDDKVRNWCHMLRHDSRYQTLRSKVLSAVERGELSSTDQRNTSALLALSERIMPSAKGSHTSILGASDPLLDRIVSEL